MNSYLERLLSAPLQSPLASEPAEIVIAGHAPGLQKVAAKKADGLFLFLQTLETVKNARKIIGPEKSLPVAVRCVLDDNPTSARNLARKACAFYMSLPAYHRVWSSLGFKEADWSNGGSDRLIDAICAWGNPETIKKKLQNYVDAGATQLVIYPCNPGEDYKPDSALSVGWHWELLEALS